MYISEFNISCSTPLTFLPSESCTLSALGSSSTISTTDRHWVDCIAWWQRFFYGSTSSGEVGELIWRRGSGSFTGVRRLWGSSGLQERQWYWYGGTGSLGFQQSWFRKRGTQSFEGKGSSRRPGSKTKEYLGFEVLEGEEGSSFRYLVEV